LSSQIAQLNIRKVEEQEKASLEEFRSNEIKVQLQDAKAKVESRAYFDQLMQKEKCEERKTRHSAHRRSEGALKRIERPKSSRAECKADQSSMIIKQGSEFKLPEPVNQSISSLTSRNKSKWQNQFRSRSKGNRIQSSKSRNNVNSNQCLTERGSNYSNGTGINMKKEVFKSKSFVGFNTSSAG